MKFEHETLTGETRFAKLKFFKILLLVLKKVFCFKKLYHLFVAFLNSRKFLNFSNFDRQDFVKIQKFDLMMTSFSK